MVWEHGDVGDVESTYPASSLASCGGTSVESEKEVIIREQSWSWSKEGGDLNASQRRDDRERQGRRRVAFDATLATRAWELPGVFRAGRYGLEEEKFVVSCRTPSCA